MTPQIKILALEKRQETIKRIEDITFLMKQTYRQVEIVDTYINPHETPFGISKYKGKAKERLYAIISRLEKSYEKELEKLTEIH